MTTAVELIISEIQKSLDNGRQITQSDLDFYKQFIKPYENAQTAKAITFGVRLGYGDVYFDDKKYTHAYEQFYAETKF